MGEYKINNDSNSESIHQVFVSGDFWMGRTKVTQKQWQKIMGIEEIHPEKPSPLRSLTLNYSIASVI